MLKIKAGIINVTGYAGLELARLLYYHPDVALVSVSGRSAIGKKLNEVFPNLVDIQLTIEDDIDNVDVVFSAMPHKASAEAILPVVKKGIKVIDISADFRLRKAEQYPEWYDFAHPAPEMLAEAVYGLPELYRSRIAKSFLVANPGCYPTGAILALAPLVKEGLIEADIIIDSKSGVSGAGRTLSLNTHYAEAVDNVSAYSLKGHRHLPEMVQELELLRQGWHSSITFLPHLIPMSRGILSSCYVKLSDTSTFKNGESLIGFYIDFYAQEPFVRIVKEPPGTKQTWGSNYCFIYPHLDKRTGRVIVISCLDNLVKGAAGQAIQNMNIMFGFSETAGLEGLPIYP